MQKCRPGVSVIVESEQYKRPRCFSPLDSPWHQRLMMFIDDINGFPANHLYGIFHTLPYINACYQALNLRLAEHFDNSHTANQVMRGATKNINEKRRDNTKYHHQNGKQESTI